MGRTSRHARIPPTREVFYSPSDGTGVTEKDTHVGYLLDDQADECYIEVYVPWDFKEIVELVITVIPVTTGFLAAMTLSVDLEFSGINHLHNENDVIDAAGVPIQFSWNAVADYIQEVNITQMVLPTNIFSERGLKAGDYIGIHVVRDATNDDNTNAVILGARMRYKVFKGK